VITLPDNSTVGGGFETRTPTMEPGQSASPPTFTQQVPAAAPAGSYTFTFNLGRAFPVPDIDSDSFTFTKSATAVESGRIVERWGLFDAETGRRITARYLDRFFGPSSLSKTGTAESAALPETFALEQNYPNPFNPSTQISFALPEASEVELEIYNIMGQKVRTLVSSSFQAGFHALQWDGANDFGQRVASGIYLYKLQAGSFVQTKRMILMK